MTYDNMKNMTQRAQIWVHDNITLYGLLTIEFILTFTKRDEKWWKK